MNINKTFIIAELSANHNNDFDLAVKTIESMAQSGADAVKFQTYRAESLAINIENEYFPKSQSGLWKGYTPWTLFEEASMPYEWQPKLKKIAEDLGLVCFSSPFDHEGVDFLEQIDCPIYKVASPEINDLRLIEYMAIKNKPMIISTGMSSLSDIAKAVETCRLVGNNDITLLKCTSEYPAPYDKANLLTIPNMRDTFGVKVGVSDHTMGSIVPIVSVALGATVVEKHYILDRKMEGPDSAFSMEPAEFKLMVEDIRNAEVSVGKVNYDLSPKALNQRRFLFYLDDIKAGDIITDKNIRSVRGKGNITSDNYNNLIGKHLNKNVKKGTPINFSDFIQ